MNKFLLKSLLVLSFLVCANQKSYATKITVGLDPLGVNYYLGADSVISLVVNEGDSIEWFYYGLGNATDFWTIFDSPLGTSQTLNDADFIKYTVFSLANGYSYGPFFMSDLVSYDIGFGPVNFSVGLEIIMAAGAPLNINNAKLNAAATSKGNLLNWNFSKANDCSNIILEKSTDGINFSSVAIINNANQFLDDNISATTTYYRLQYTESNTIKYSNIAKLTNTFSIVKVYPNPANNILNIQSNEPIAMVNIYNTNGVLVATSKALPIDIANLAAGTYMVNALTTSGKKISEKIIKN